MLPKLTLQHLCELLRDRFDAPQGVIKIGGGGREDFLAPLTATLFVVGGNPFTAMVSGEMDEGVGLRLGPVFAIRERAGVMDAPIFPRVAFGDFAAIRMAGGEMLVICGFLDKPAIFRILTIPTGKFEILEMRGFDVVIHGILFFTDFWTMRALKVAIVETDVVGGRGGHLGK